ncbi:16S rRNA (uracil(1498)-N(3))-methyltransferase [Sediminibacterium sp. C3]|uniref:RsmE family RNA methyltransferase n=1 Tax=Sediminibacterium sp. C3 TaxID=1267211 RepID=UPI000405C8E0|nr:RsmE family RNA methyltransferase [Sediminibacterium sp. C3]
MDIPFFYEADLPVTPGLFTLSEESSKHCSVVLRMQPGESISLTNGLGLSCIGKLVSADKKKTVVQLFDHKQESRTNPQNSIAISFVKNAARMEWFLEKATEIGIDAFYPLIAERTERTHFKKERWEHILVSAMLQSKQVFKPVLHEPVEFKILIQQPLEGHLLMAHCENGPKQLIQSIDKSKPALLLIGPEGDFSPAEILMAEKAGATMINLGVTRLRTETAGIAAAVLLQHR